MNDLPPMHFLKMLRAKQHLAQLIESSSPYMQHGNAFSVINEIDTETGSINSRIKFNIQLPIYDWSLMIGDCIHNLRCALDHLFKELVLKNNPNFEINKSSNFPIIPIKSTFKGNEKLYETLVGMDVTKAIEKMQPYNHPNGFDAAALYLLSQYDIQDKHTLLIPTLHILDTSKIICNMKDNQPRNVTSQLIYNFYGLEDNAIIATTKCEIPKEIVQVDLKIEPTLYLIFGGQFPPLATIDVLQEFIAVVELVSSELIPYLKK